MSIRPATAQLPYQGRRPRVHRGFQRTAFSKRPCQLYPRKIPFSAIPLVPLVSCCFTHNTDPFQHGPITNNRTALCKQKVAAASGPAPVPPGSKPGALSRYAMRPLKSVIFPLLLVIWTCYGGISPNKCPYGQKGKNNEKITNYYWDSPYAGYRNIHSLSSE